MKSYEGMTSGTWTNYSDFGSDPVQNESRPTVPKF